MNNVSELATTGTSVWLDDLSRDRLTSGNLAGLIADTGIAGVTTNPAIFAKAMTSSTAYDTQLATLSQSGSDASTAVFAMAVDDVATLRRFRRHSCAASAGVDGRRRSRSTRGWPRTRGHHRPGQAAA